MMDRFLQELPLLSSLAKDDIEELAQVMTAVDFPPRVVLFREGDAGDCLYVVRNGEVEVIKRMEMPEEQLLRVLKTGDYFGEMSLFNPRETRSASVRTRTSVQLLKLSRDAFTALVERRPAILAVMVRELTARFSDSEKVLIRALRKTKLKMRKQSSALQDAENLATMGRALSSLAHDLKTPLIAIGGFTRLVQRHLDEGSADRDRLAIVLAETQRLESMVKEMLDFARPLELHCALAEIPPLLDQSLAVVSQIAEERGIGIEKAVSVNLPPVFVDQARLQQALINLLLNAIQASTTGQTVTIACLEGSAGLSIEVRDCGCGIPAERREKVLSPFFTTKKEGTGLGLAIVSKIVEAHRGTIEILDNPGGGTVIKMVIPQPAT
jgi:signal transduction histidine kinase